MVDLPLSRMPIGGAGKGGGCSMEAETWPPDLGGCVVGRTSCSRTHTLNFVQPFDVNPGFAALSTLLPVFFPSSNPQVKK
jgi:hypothetical protein